MLLKTTYPIRCHSCDFFFLMNYQWAWECHIQNSLKSLTYSHACTPLTDALCQKIQDIYLREHHCPKLANVLNQCLIFKVFKITKQSRHWWPWTKFWQRHADFPKSQPNKVWKFRQETVWASIMLFSFWRCSSQQQSSLTSILSEVACPEGLRIYQDAMVHYKVY